MKTIILTLSLSVLTLTAIGQEVQNSGTAAGTTTTTVKQKQVKKPEFKWNEMRHDFGKIPMGKPVTLTYTFKNVGNAPLIVTAVKPGCGCTTADYTKEPVQPGKKGFITVVFNAASPGPFSKSVSLTSNVDDQLIVLTFHGEVIQETTPTAP